jgi:phage head maturation protease
MAAPYDVVSDCALPFRDGPRRVRFAPGAFADTIRRGPLVECWGNHRKPAWRPYGGQHDDSLLFIDGPAGLGFALRVREPMHRDFLEAMAEAEALTGVSPGWETEAGAWEGDVFVVSRAKLFEISLTTKPNRPAFGSTWVRRMERAVTEPVRRAPVRF